MKGKRLFRCICCGGLTLHRFKEWWIHKGCENELRNYLLQWEKERLLLKLELMDWGKALALFLNDPERFREYADGLEHEAWKAFIAKYGKPSWCRGGETFIATFDNYFGWCEGWLSV